MTWPPTVNVAKRAMTNASPRSPAVTTPSVVIGGRVVVVAQEQRPGCVTSRSVPSEYFARTVICCVRALAVEHGRRRIELDADGPWRLSAGVVRRRRPRASGPASRSTRSPCSNRLPPVCGTSPVAFSISRLSSGDGEVDAPAADLAGEAVVVAVGVEAEQRQAEAVLAAGRAVAAAGVAAGPHEDRHHVELEADRPVGRGVLDRHRHRDRLAADTRPSAPSRRRPPGRDVGRRASRAPGWRAATFACGGDVARDAVGAAWPDDERSAGRGWCRG